MLAPAHPARFVSSLAVILFLAHDGLPQTPPASTPSAEPTQLCEQLLQVRQAVQEIARQPHLPPAERERLEALLQSADNLARLLPGTPGQQGNLPAQAVAELTKLSQFAQELSRTRNPAPGQTSPLIPPALVEQLSQVTAVVQTVHQIGQTPSLPPPSGPAPGPLPPGVPTAEHLARTASHAADSAIQLAGTLAPLVGETPGASACAADGTAIPLPLAHGCPRCPSRPGWFLGTELALVSPSIAVRLGTGDSVGTDFELGTAVSPTFLAGYRFDDGSRAAYATYRYLASEGRLDAAVNRLDLNDLGVNYHQQLDVPWGNWAMSWEAGARLATIFYDRQEQGWSGDFLNQPVEQVSLRQSSHFVGAGPSAGYNASYQVTPGLAAFGHADFGLLFGQQQYRSNFRPEGKHSLTVKAFRILSGVNWSPAGWEHCQLQFGYQFERWWDIGQFNNHPGDLLIHGLFANCMFRF